MIIILKIAPRIKLQFEIDDRTITLVNNNDEELAHLANKPMRLEELIMKLRYSGIMICPTEQDINYATGYKIKV